MDPLTVIGAFIMTFAFLAYGIGSITLERFRIVGNVVLVFMTVGILLEATAIILMVMGTDVHAFSLHVLVGVIAFLLYLINFGWSWSLYLRHGIDTRVTKSLLNYTKTAFFIWVTAYLVGIVLLIWT